MTQPNARTVHINAALSTFASAYENGLYVADQVCPVIPVAKKSDSYFTFARADIASIVDDRVGPVAHVTESGYAQSSTSYAVEDRAQMSYLSNDTIGNADAPLDPKSDTTEIILNRIMLGHERRVSVLLNTTGSYASANTSASSNVWSDETSGTPVADFATMTAAIPPFNPASSRLIAVMAKEVWQALRKHPDMRGGGSLEPVVSRQKAAEILELDEILVSDAQYISTQPGQTATYARVWTATTCILARVPTGAPKVKEGLLCGSFRWNGAMGTGADVMEWDAPDRGPRGAQAIKVSLSDDEGIIQNDMGYLMTGVLS